MQTSTRQRYQRNGHYTRRMLVPLVGATAHDLLGTNREGKSARGVVPRALLMDLPYSG